MSSDNVAPLIEHLAFKPCKLGDVMSVEQLNDLFAGDRKGVLRDIARLALSATRPDAANAGANEPLAASQPRRLSQRQLHRTSENHEIAQGA